MVVAVNVKSLMSGRCSVVGHRSQAGDWCGLELATSTKGLQQLQHATGGSTSSYLCRAVEDGSAAAETDTTNFSETLQSKEEPHQTRDEHGVLVSPEL
jgi:hypothetical protein